MSLNKAAQYKGLGSQPGTVRSSPPAERLRPKPVEIARREAPFDFTFIPEQHYLPASFVYSYAARSESRPEQRLSPAAVQTIHPLSNQNSSASAGGYTSTYIASTRVNSSHTPSMNEGAFALISNQPLHLQNDGDNAVVQLLKVGVQLQCRHQQQRTTESTQSQQAGAYLAVLQRDEKIGHVQSGIIQEVRQRRKYLLSRITSPQWEIAHHYHATALEHSLGRKQPNVIEVAEMLRGHLVIYSMARRTTLNQKVLIFSLNRAKKSRSLTGDHIKITYAKLKSCRQQLKYVNESLISIKRTTQKAYEKQLPSVGEAETDSPAAHLVNSLRSLLEYITIEENHGKVGGFISNNNAQRQGVKARFLQTLNIAPGNVPTSHLADNDELDPTSMDSNMKSLLHSVNDTQSSHVTSQQMKSYSNDFTQNEALVTDNAHRSAHDVMKQMPGPIQYDDENTEDVETMLLQSGATDENINTNQNKNTNDANDTNTSNSNNAENMNTSIDESKDVTTDELDNASSGYSPAVSSSGLQSTVSPPHITDIISNVSKLILEDTNDSANVAVEAPPAVPATSSAISIGSSTGTHQPLRVQSMSSTVSSLKAHSSLQAKSSFGMASSPSSLRDFRKGTLLTKSFVTSGDHNSHVVVVNAPRPISMTANNTPSSTSSMLGTPKSAYSYSSQNNHGPDSSPRAGTGSNNNSLVIDSTNVLKAPKTIVASSLSQMLRDSQNNADPNNREPKFR